MHAGAANCTPHGACGLPPAARRTAPLAAASPSPGMASPKLVLAWLVQLAQRLCWQRPLCAGLLRRSAARWRARVTPRRVCSARAPTDRHPSPPGACAALCALSRQVLLEHGFEWLEHKWSPSNGKRGSPGLLSMLSFIKQVGTARTLPPTAACPPAARRPLPGAAPLAANHVLSAAPAQPAACAPPRALPQCRPTHRSCSCWV